MGLGVVSFSAMSKRVASAVGALPRWLLIRYPTAGLLIVEVMELAAVNRCRMTGISWPWNTNLFTLHINKWRLSSTTPTKWP